MPAIYTLLTTPRPPPPSLGFLNRTSTNLTVAIGGDEFELAQSPGLLNSSHRDGTTGAVVWRLSIPLAEWLQRCISGEIRGGDRVLTNDARVLELGCGIAGLLAMAVGPRVKRWIATDVESVMRGLRGNLKENLANEWEEVDGGSSFVQKAKKAAKKKSSTTSTAEFGRIDTVRLHWEEDDVATMPIFKDDEALPLDMIVSCDCVYNSVLIPHLLSTLVDVSNLSLNSGGKMPKVLVVMEIRAEDVLEVWVNEFHKYFNGGVVTEEVLGDDWKERGGVNGVAFLGILREEFVLKPLT